MSLTELAFPTEALAKSPYSDWVPSALAGDASSRRYWRLCDGDGSSAILMDNGSADGNSFPAFEAMSNHLCALGLIAPRILYVSEDRRFAILTDLGPETLAAHIRSVPLDEPKLLASLVDVLPLLNRKPPPPGLPLLTPDRGAQMIAPLFETAAIEAPQDLRDEIKMGIGEAMHTLCDPPTALALRDFHAENVIWRQRETGTDRFGLLDFQDAFVAPSEYDLASLLRDVRREVAPEALDMAHARFAAQSGKSLTAVSAACATLALQRNLRIYGVFARLSADMGKTRYLAFLPRTARLILEDAAHPSLARIAEPIERLMRQIKI